MYPYMSSLPAVNRNPLTEICIAGLLIFYWGQGCVAQSQQRFGLGSNFKMVSCPLSRCAVLCLCEDEIMEF